LDGHLSSLRGGAPWRQQAQRRLNASGRATGFVFHNAFSINAEHVFALQKPVKGRTRAWRHVALWRHRRSVMAGDGDAQNTRRRLAFSPYADIAHVAQRSGEGP